MATADSAPVPRLLGDGHTSTALAISNADFQPRPEKSKGKPGREVNPRKSCHPYGSPHLTKLWKSYNTTAELSVSGYRVLQLSTTLALEACDDPSHPSANVFSFVWATGSV